MKLLRFATATRRLPWVVAFIMMVSACAMPMAAQAHPHVWVTITTELLYTPAGAVSAVRHAWTFDDMFSSYATMGIAAATKGQFTREELRPLAQVNVESLKEFAYFTYARINGKREKDAFADPVDYWLDYDPDKTVLTLHFTLPFKIPVPTKQLRIEVYDPEFFIDFEFADANPVKLVGAPAQCAAWTEKPNDENFLKPQRLNRDFIPPEANVGMGINFANKIMVQCP
jgi:ABC-type uncharacterized transport system substrate-binding protein